MWRSILAIVAGVVVGGITVGIIELPGSLMYPPPAIKDAAISEATMKQYLESLPLLPKLAVGIAWIAGPFIGAWTAARIARRAPVAHGLIIGAVFLLMDIAMIATLPHPFWLAAIGIVAPLIAGYLGASVAGKMMDQKNAGPQPYDMREKNMAC